jgi:predicted nucleic-acid-binding protein
MIAIDTNVLVRFLTQDEPNQGQSATELIASLTEEEPGFICREVMIELVWVLERSYHFDRETIARAIEGLLSAAEIDVETGDNVAPILHLYENENFGFADLMIRQAALNNGAKCLFTFDQKAARLDGVVLVNSKSHQ